MGSSRLRHKKVKLGTRNLTLKRSYHFVEVFKRHGAISFFCVTKVAILSMPICFSTLLVAPLSWGSTSSTSPSWRWISVASSNDGTKLAAVTSGVSLCTSSDSEVMWTEAAIDIGWQSDHEPGWNHLLNVTKCKAQRWQLCLLMASPGSPATLVPRGLRLHVPLASMAVLILSMSHKRLPSKKLHHELRWYS